MKQLAHATVVVPLLALSGCAALSTPASPPSAAHVTASATTSPSAPTETPVVAPPLSPTAPEFVYRNPKIGVVYLRAYQDAAGRLFGPQVMYQIAEPGGWNLDAVEDGRPLADASFEIPARSLAIAPARGAQERPADSPLLDPAKAAQITLTGLMRQEDQAQAEAMARQAGDRVAMFDTEAGWLLMPADAPPIPR